MLRVVLLRKTSILLIIILSCADVGKVTLVNVSVWVRSGIFFTISTQTGRNLAKIL